MDIITTVLTALLFSTEEKVVQGRMIWNRVPVLREVYKSPGQSAFWPKGGFSVLRKGASSLTVGSQAWRGRACCEKISAFTLDPISKPRPSQLQIHCQFSADPQVPELYSCKINQYRASMILNSISSTESPLHLFRELLLEGTLCCVEVGGSTVHTDTPMQFHTNLRC